MKSRTLLNSAAGGIDVMPLYFFLIPRSPFLMNGKMHLLVHLVSLFCLYTWLFHRKSMSSIFVFDTSGGTLSRPAAFLFWNFYLPNFYLPSQSGWQWIIFYWLISDFWKVSWRVLFTSEVFLLGLQRLSTSCK